MTTLAAERKEISVPGLAPGLSHYCDAVVFNDTAYISGITALDKNNVVVGGDDVVAQAEAVFSTMNTVLENLGASFSDILKVTVLLTDVNDREKINPVRQRFFGNSKPASTLFEVSSLALPEMKVEIEAVVGLPKA